MKDITVFIPVYNNESTIIQTLESLEKQNINTIAKIIIIDDGSTDKSKELIYVFAKNSKFSFEIRENKKPSGLAYKYNQILSEIKTTYLLLMHADIIIEENDAIETYRNEMEKDNTIYRIYGFEKMDLKFWSKYNFRLKLEWAPFVYDTIKNGGYPFSGCKFDMLDVSKIKGIGGFNNKKYLKAGEDADLYLRIKEFGGKISVVHVTYTHLHSFDEMYSFRKFLKRKFMYRQSTGVLLRSHFKTHWNNPTLYIRLLITFVMLLGILLALCNGSYFLLLFSIFLVILYTYHYCRLFINRKYWDYRILFMPFLFIYLILGGAYSFFDGFIKNKQTF